MKPIASGLSPNTEKEDVQKALSLLLTPWSYIAGDNVKMLEQWFRQYFSVSYAVSFNSGRGALYGLLKTLGIGKDDEVLVQAFTCAVVVNPILALGAKPIYLDVTPQLTIDPKDLEKKISKKTKAIIVQHTFGISSPMPEILKIAKKIPVIEDAAHTIGGVSGSKKLGTHGTAAIFSFGRDKAFSSVFGGMAITNNEELGKKLRAFQKQLPSPSYWWVFQQLLHPVLFSIVLPLYDILHLGKVLLVITQKLKLISFPVESEEKKGKIQRVHIQKLPNALAALALLQLRKIKRFNDTRESAVKEYLASLNPSLYEMPVGKSMPLLRFPVYTNKAQQIVTHARKKGIYLGRWYSEVIDPKGTDLTIVGYKKGTCPVAEKCAENILNLPTYPTMTREELQKVVKVLNAYV